MLFDDKSILAEYIYNDPSFNNGLNNFEWILQKNINNSGKFDKIYHYNSEDEEYLKDVYDRIVLFIANDYFSPNHRAERKYMKSSELYMCYYIFTYFELLFRYRKERELKYFMEKNEYGSSTKVFNNVGKVAIKAYLASAIVLNEAGIIADYNIENIKDSIEKNRM